MKCPVDGADLVMTERSGVEIDYCPQCRGVWLDRGELDKIIERAAAPAAPQTAYPPQAPQAPYPPGPGYPPGGYRYDDDSDRRHPGQYGSRKKKGFLGDLFDF